MSRPNSISKLRTIALIYRHRILNNNAFSNPLLYTHQRHGFLNHFSISHTANGRFYKVPTNISKDDKDKHQQQPTAPPRPGFPSWVKWLFGSILSVFVPYCKQKRDKFLLLEAEKIVEEMETVAEVVEKVAATAEKLSTNMANKLSDDTKLKQGALMVEGLSIVVEKDAQLTADFLHKVGDIEEDLKELKTIVQPLNHINKSTHVGRDGN